MNNIEICLTPKLIDNYRLDNKIIVIVDILRATTIITTLFENGLAKLIPVNSLEEAEKYKEQGFLVAAERDGRKVDFADFGNSPFEFTPDRVEKETLVYSTTNGTNTINLVRNADEVIIASFLNLRSVVEYVVKQNKDVLILCSGWMQDFCTEDFLFSGALTEKLIIKNNFSYDSDQVQSALDLWRIAKDDLSKYIKKLFQYKRLMKFGFKEIIDYCFQFDLSEVLPVVKENYITDLKKIAPT